MPGLGDIVIPGVFIGLALRYDHDREGGKSKAHFHGTLVGFLGLVVSLERHNLVGD
jgi:minor histocompatibility antigen H13